MGNYNFPPMFQSTFTSSEMTMRDYVAVQAMTALISSPKLRETANVETIIEQAFEFADTFLEMKGDE